ncbi:MAG: His/Gly/Thr/Pro-type tRNA ligase C-terminal domain-containing protein, partial [Candidatus Woesearchaeota archaeon]
GTPYCLTIDFDSLKNNDITIRERDTTEQKRIKINKLTETLASLLNDRISFKDL